MTSAEQERYERLVAEPVSVDLARRMHYGRG